MALSSISSKSPFDFRRPQLALVKDNSIRSRPLALSIPLASKVWPKSFNRLWRVSKLYRLPFKPFEFYVPFQRFFPFPSPTHGSFFRIQTQVFVYWYQFHSRSYCIVLDYGSKEKKLLKETSLWLRQSNLRIPSRLTFWSFFQRAFSLTSKSPTFPFFQLNSNKLPLYFSKSTPSSYWFEEVLADIRVFSWNFYSRLQVSSLQTTLSQASFDKNILRRRTPWSPSVLWLSSPIHDYSALIPSYFSTNSLIMPEMFFQFFHQFQITSARWSQLFFCFWSFSHVLISSSWVQFSKLFLIKGVLSFYGKNRLFFKIFSNFKCRSRFFFNFLFFFKDLIPDFKSSSFSALQVHSATIFYEAKALPLMTQVAKPRRFKSTRTPWNKVSVFPDKDLYFRYLRRLFVLNPSFINFSNFLQERLIDLNFFMFLFFQNFSLNKSATLSQVLYLWVCCLNEVALSSSEPGLYAYISPNSKNFFFAKSAKVDTSSVEEETSLVKEGTVTPSSLIEKSSSDFSDFFRSSKV